MENIIFNDQYQSNYKIVALSELVTTFKLDVLIHNELLESTNNGNNNYNHEIDKIMLQERFDMINIMLSDNLYYNFIDVPLSTFYNLLCIDEKKFDYIIMILLPHILQLYKDNDMEYFYYYNKLIDEDDNDYVKNLKLIKDNIDYKFQLIFINILNIINVNYITINHTIFLQDIIHLYEKECENLGDLNNTIKINIIFDKITSLFIDIKELYDETSANEQYYNEKIIQFISTNYMQIYNNLMRMDCIVNNKHHDYDMFLYDTKQLINDNLHHELKQIFDETLIHHYLAESYLTFTDFIYIIQHYYNHILYNYPDEPHNSIKFVRLFLKKYLDAIIKTLYKDAYNIQFGIKICLTNVLKLHNNKFNANHTKSHTKIDTVPQNKSNSMSLETYLNKEQSTHNQYSNYNYPNHNQYRNQYSNHNQHYYSNNNQYSNYHYNQNRYHYDDNYYYNNDYFDRYDNNNNSTLLELSNENKQTLIDGITSIIKQKLEYFENY